MIGRIITQRWRRNEATAATLTIHHPIGLKQKQGLANRHARHAKPHSEFPFGWQLISAAIRAFDDLFGELVTDHNIDWRACYGQNWLGLFGQIGPVG